MSRKDRQEDWDNGMTVAPMNGDELPTYRRAAFQNRENTPKHKRQKSDVTRKEQRAMIRASYVAENPCRACRLWTDCAHHLALAFLTENWR